MAHTQQLVAAMPCRGVSSGARCSLRTCSGVWPSLLVGPVAAPACSSSSAASFRPYPEQNKQEVKHWNCVREWRECGARLQQQLC